MRIYSMTATFGKLEHQTLTLEPGLNILQAPNEWGKSTWCAFLSHMFYGIDTRAKSTKSSLADKERFAPWSGSPMSGRIDLNWQGRDITIERRSKGRLIFGDFRAYETATGLELPELNGSNCGQMLLGVEQSVFARAGFLRLSDLPVTQDDALRRRLNDLVTTGDESGTADKLRQNLKELKNKCRYNRSGLIPQAEEQRTRLQAQLDELQQLAEQSQRLRQQQEHLEQQLDDLENHKLALLYTASAANGAKLAQAQAAAKQAEADCQAMEERCSALPTAQEAQEALQAGSQLQKKWQELQLSPLPPKPEAPHVPMCYVNLTVSEAQQQAQKDAEQSALLQKRCRKPPLWHFLPAALLLAAGAGLLAARLSWGWLALGAGAAAAVVALALRLVLLGKCRAAREDWTALNALYAPLRPDQGALYVEKIEKYRHALAEYKRLTEDQQAKTADLQAEIRRFSPDGDLNTSLEQWRQILADQQALCAAQQRREELKTHAEALETVAKPAPPAPRPDFLTLPMDQTEAALERGRQELQRIHRLLGQNQGRSEALGQEEALQARLKALNARLHRLEETYYALELAQNALTSATSELQRRFAPRIARRAQELFARMTAGRYDRLSLAEDLSLHAGARDEDTLRSALWRSDGTVDQLYLALRLAVAEALTPDAPLILDDALVRFDDDRLAAAMDILAEEAQNKQVLMFTCQGRELAYKR